LSSRSYIRQLISPWPRNTPLANQRVPRQNGRKIAQAGAVLRCLTVPAW
jgi:hypothetical protein